MANQIIHVKKFAGKERFKKPVAGDCAHFVFCFNKRQQVALLLLARHALDEFFHIIEVRAQLAHDRVAAPNFFRRCGDGDARIYHVDFVSRLPLYQRSSRSRERAARVPRMITETELPRISRAEYIRSLRPEVTTGSRKILNLPSFRSARLKMISSPMKNCSSKPPIASKFLRLVKRKAPAPRLQEK